MTPGGIIVGYDGSAPSVAAARWSAREAMLRHSSLAVITCFGTLPEWTLPTGVIGYDVSALERSAQDVSSALVGDLRTRFPEVSCAATTVVGEPRDVLLRASAHASMLVVGATTSRGIVRLCAGSVASSIVRRGHCPVVVVPGATTNHTQIGRVVVGMDCSPAASAALNWATDEATIRGAELVIVHAWMLTFDGPATRRTEPLALAMADARVTLNRGITAARFRAPGCVVHGRLVEDRAATALVAATGDADLVVLGSSTHGALRASLSGSTVRAVVRDSRCPVAVIPPPAPSGPAIGRKQLQKISSGI